VNIEKFANVSNYEAYYVMQNSEGGPVLGMFSGYTQNGRGGFKQQRRKGEGSLRAKIGNRVNRRCDPATGLTLIRGSANSCSLSLNL
jgi:hypothetical protein